VENKCGSCNKVKGGHTRKLNVTIVILNRGGKIMARYVPNMISMLRIILSVLLIPFIPVRVVFIAMYIAIGITDVLDGHIARKLGCESDFGAKLDSIADFVFYSIVVFIFIKLYSSILEGPHQVALIVIISTRLVNILLTKLKYKRVVFIHTLANKTAGFIAYIIPIVFLFVHDGIVLWIILIIVFITAMEELLITIKYTEPDLNRRSIFFK